MLKIKVNHINFLVNNKLSVLEACSLVGLQIPRFCYHEILSVAGNCRMCLVEIEKFTKPIISCAMPLSNNMSVITNSALVKKARENVLETLLLNHPLDCPICDQSGECDLQDQVQQFGGDSSRFFFQKRSVEDKNYGLFIKTIMTRCIHCTRCVRFSEEYTGVNAFGVFNRGFYSEIGSYTFNMFNSEISGNVIDLCPVGALTSKVYAFKTRPWELKSQETLDCLDGFGSNIIINYKESEIIRIQPKYNKNLNNFIISDKIRFSFDFNSKNRIKTIKKKNNFSYNLIDLKNILEIFQTTLNDKKNLTVVINNNIDLETAALFHSLQEGCLAKKVNLYSLNKLESTTNLIWEETNLIKVNKQLEKNNKICFVFSINLQVECAILNSKIRLKYNQSNLKIYGSGFYTKNNTATLFLNLSILNIIQTFEGKNVLSKQLIKFPFSILICGTSIHSCVKNINNIFILYKKFCSSGLVLNVKSNSNFKGLSFLGLRSLKKQALTKNSILFFINLEDDIRIRCIIKNLKKKLTFWFNTHGSIIATKTDFILPTTTFLEEEKVYINYNNLPQKTQVVFKNLLYFDTFIKFFDFLTNNLKKNKTSLIFLNFQKELIKKKFLLQKFFFCNNKQQLLLKTKINILYPIKSFIEDFYLTSTLTKNSIMMNKRSQEYRKISKNF